MSLMGNRDDVGRISVFLGWWVVFGATAWLVILLVLPASLTVGVGTELRRPRPVGHEAEPPAEA